MVRLGGRRLPSEEGGAVAIIFGICLTLLLGFAAVVVDLGFGRQLKAQAQNVADFAALAGAGVLVDGTPAQATGAARDFVSRNGFPGDDAEVNVPPLSGSREGDPECVQVRPYEIVPTVFGRVFTTGSMTVAAQATACASPGLGGPYAVFGGSATCDPPVRFSASNRTINGGVHSNNTVRVTGAGTTVNGDLTYLAGDAPVSNITYNPSTGNPTQISHTLAYPEVFEPAHYAPGGLKAALAQSQWRYYNAGSSTIDHAWLTLNEKVLLNPLTGMYDITPGIYYTTGDIHLGGGNYKAAAVTLVSGNGDIHLNGNNMDFSPWDPDGLLIASFKDQPSCSSGQAVIKLNGNNHTWTGVMFAPHGPIDFSGTNIGSSMNGRLVANVVSLSGSNQTITRNEAYPGRTDGFELVE